MTEDLYYLVRPGTNVRALTRDNQPLMVTEAGIDPAIESLDHIVSPHTGRLEPVPVAEYHRRWDGAKTAAKKQLHEELYEGTEYDDDWK